VLLIDHMMLETSMPPPVCISETSSPWDQRHQWGDPNLTTTLVTSMLIYKYTHHHPLYHRNLHTMLGLSAQVLKDSLLDLRSDYLFITTYCLKSTVVSVVRFL